MKDTPLILSVDTATSGGSVCLTRGSDLLSTRLGDPAVSHSNSLLKDINEILLEANVGLGDVNLLAAASGPGSFTGLRIGLATVKALAATLQIACVGIPTLHAVALAAGQSQSTVALLPAGRGEVFLQLLSVSSTQRVTPRDEPAHLSPPRMLEKYGSLKTLTWTGPGAYLYRDLLRSYAQEQGIEFDEESRRAVESFQGWRLGATEENFSKYVAALALQRYETNDVGGPLLLNAIYVRPSDAELKCP